jgi:hypothetical protein
VPLRSLWSNSFRVIRVSRIGVGLDLPLLGIARLPTDVSSTFPASAGCRNRVAPPVCGARLVWQEGRRLGLVGRQFAIGYLAPAVAARKTDFAAHAGTKSGSPDRAAAATTTAALGSQHFSTVSPSSRYRLGSCVDIATRACLVAVLKSRSSARQEGLMVGYGLARLFAQVAEDTGVHSSTP